MTGEVDNVREQVQAVEQKLDSLSASVDARFDAVDAALIEQRQYTEFAFDRLASEMKAGFSSVDARFSDVDDRFNNVDGRFNRLEGHFNRLEGHFNRLEGRFDRLEGRFDGLEGRFNGLEGRFDRLEGHFDRVERKLDQFIDTQSRANELVERRLRALEPQSGQQ